MGAFAPVIPKAEEPRNYQPESRRVTMQALHGLGRCLVDSRPHAVAALLAQAPGRRDGEFARANQTAMNWCLTTIANKNIRLGFKVHNLRGPLAEALFKRHFDGWVARSDFRPVVPYDIEAAFAAPGTTADERALLTTARFAQCVVEVAPDLALSLLRTRPGTPEEEAAKGPLRPTFSTCFARDRSFALGQSNLRGIIAEAAYRRAVHLASKETALR